MQARSHFFHFFTPLIFPASLSQQPVRQKQNSLPLCPRSFPHMLSGLIKLNLHLLSGRFHS